MHTTVVGKYCASFFETGRQSLPDHMYMDPVQQYLRMYSDCGTTRGNLLAHSLSYDVRFVLGELDLLFSKHRNEQGYRNPAQPLESPEARSCLRHNYNR